MALSVKTGSFAKSTGIAPTTQAVTGVGFQPKALILWMAGGTASGTAVLSWRGAIGCASSASDDFSMAYASDDNVSDGTAWRRMSDSIFITANGGGSILARGDLTSFDSDGFTIDWNNNNAVANIIHYMALGGADLTNAKALEWQMPTTATNKAVTGVGFVPDCVITFHAADVGSSTIPINAGHGGWGIGVMTTSAQWCTAAYSEDGVPTTDTYRAQRTDSMLVSPSITGTTLMRATYVSMDSDGFTTNFATVDGTAHRLFSLCLKGGQYKVGNFGKSTAAATVSQAVTGVGFLPTGYLLASHQTTTGTSIGAHARMGIGASDGSGEQSMAFSDTDALNTSSVDAVDKTDKVFAVMDNNTATINAQADHSSLDSDGFTLSWTTNHATATEILYLAIGNAGSADQGLTILGIASGENAGFPASSLTLNSTPGVSSGEALSSPAVKLNTAPLSVQSAETLGASTIGMNLAPVSVASGEAAGNSVVGFSLTPLSINTGEQLGFTAASLFVLGAGIGSSETLGGVTVTPGAVTVVPLGIETGEGHGAHFASLTVSPIGAASLESGNSPVVTLGVTPSAINSEEASGSTSVSALPATSLLPTGIGSGEAVISPAMTFDITPLGVNPQQEFGNLSTTLFLLPAAILPDDDFGEASLGLIVGPLSVASGESFGTGLVSVGDGIISPLSISTGEVIGSVTMTIDAGSPFVTVAAHTRSFGIRLKDRVYSVPAQIRTFTIRFRR